MANKHLTFLVNVLFTLKYSFGVFAIDKFHDHSVSGVCCIFLLVVCDNFQCLKDLH